jgi:hypothetical protein
VARHSRSARFSIWRDARDRKNPVKLLSEDRSQAIISCAPLLIVVHG